MHVTDTVPRPVRYLGVGATGVLVDLLVTTGVAMVVGLLPAQAVGWAVAASWNWRWNTMLTWDGDGTLAEWATYCTVDAGRLAVRLVVVWAVIDAVPGLVATAAGIASAAALGFLGFDRLVFTSSET